MINTKHEVVRAGVDLKEFFEASICALQHDGEALKTADLAKGRNRPLVVRTRTDASATRRTVADAARALTAMWRPRTS
jgi:hypothetical protein